MPAVDMAPSPLEGHVHIPLRLAESLIKLRVKLVPELTVIVILKSDRGLGPVSHRQRRQAGRRMKRVETDQHRLPRARRQYSRDLWRRNWLEAMLSVT